MPKEGTLEFSDFFRGGSSGVGPLGHWAIGVGGLGCWIFPPMDWDMREIDTDHPVGTNPFNQSGK
jgi:hypothetical protein